MYKIAALSVPLLLYFCLLAGSSTAQNAGGFWLGVIYPTDPDQEVYNYTMQLTQTGAQLGGTSQTADPNLPFGGVAYLSGNVAGTSITFRESDKNGTLGTINRLCYFEGKLTYNPADESLRGTYKTIVNGTTCTDASDGTVELYRIVLKSGDTFCKGSPINLLVTGKNIRWYASASKGRVLASGNAFAPTLTQTTTYYITQTLYKNESPPVPITVTVVDPTFTVALSNTDCGKPTGAIAITPSTPGSWQYSLNGGAAQVAPRFTGLAEGSYVVTAQQTSGCQAKQTVAIATNAGPAISNLSVSPPRCGPANGEIIITASGGSTPLTYSIDGGTTTKASSRFTDLNGGTYAVRVRDANGCEVSRSVTLPQSKALTLLSADAVGTTCGRADGQATLVVAGGTRPIQYSTNGTSFGPASLFIDLKAGSYPLTARDSAGCTVARSVSVAASTAPRITGLELTPAGCDERTGIINVTTADSLNQPLFSVDGQTFQPGRAFGGLGAGTYTVTVRDNQNCAVTQTAALAADCQTLMHLPTAFSPNADQANDGLTVHFRFPSVTVDRFTVYDRWGAVIYNRANFVLNNGEQLWDGQVAGTAALPGTYLCRLDCQFPNGTRTSVRQPVSLLH